MKQHVNIALPAVMDITAAGPLAGEILLHRGKDLMLDASGVERLGAQCLQVLLSTAATWSHDGMHLELANPSRQFSEALMTAGLVVDNFSARNS